jgi:DNA-binding FadR family transcriptional regulator
LNTTQENGFGKPMSAKVLARVRTWIASSGLSAGARLPPERDLCNSLGVSRTELRKAFLVLEANGSLTREVGRGTFLTKKPEQRKSGNTDRTISDLAEKTGPLEAMMARLALEPELARMAALHASPRQLRQIRDLATRMRNSPSWHIYEELDSEFHDIIAQASGNSLLHELHKILNGVRIVVVWRRLNTPETAPGENYHSFDEHDAIVEALEKRSGSEASKAMQIHLRSTLSTMTVNN